MLTHLWLKTGNKLQYMLRKSQHFKNGNHLPTYRVVTIRWWVYLYTLQCHELLVLVFKQILERWHIVGTYLDFFTRTLKMEAQPSATVAFCIQIWWVLNGRCVFHLLDQCSLAFRRKLDLSNDSAALLICINIYILHGFLSTVSTERISTLKPCWRWKGFDIRCKKYNKKFCSSDKDL